MEQEEKNIAIADRVTSITTINPDWGDIIIVSVDVEKLPINLKKDYLAQTAKELKKTFPNNKLVVISGKTSVTVEKDTEE